MIKTAVIGFGLSATIFHLPFIGDSDRFELVSISTRNTDQAKIKWPGISIYPTGQELIYNSSAELIIISAPNNVHFSLAKLALEQGRHVIIEKPMVTTVLEGEALIAMAKKQRKVLSVYHNRRWDGDFLTVKEIIQTSSLGRVKYFETHFDRFYPLVRDRWKEQSGSGTGNWFDLGAHLLDQTLCLFGMPQAITARCSGLRDTAKTIDFFHVALHYPDCEVVLHGSPFSAGPNIRFQVQGTKGSFIKYGYDPQENQLKAGMTPKSPQWAKENTSLFGKIYTESDFKIVPTKVGGYQHFFSGIADAINTGKSVPVSAEDALNVIYLLELGMKSSESGKTLKVKKS